MVTKTQSIELYQVYDSLGGQTLEAVVNGHIAACPGGISRSDYEAPNVSVTQALKTFEKAKLTLMGSFSQSAFDARLAKLMPKLGAQATTALSLAFYSSEHAISNNFPVPLGNVVGGGAHTPSKTKMSIQEILVLPRANTLQTAIETNFKIWKTVGDELSKRNACGLGYEAAWSADITDESALAIVSKIAKQNRAHIGIDVAASQFFKQGEYVWSDKSLDRETHIERLLKFIKKYKISYVEDPLHQDDFEGFTKILEATGGKALICGDDLISTNIDRLKRAAREQAINAVIVKPNQTGTVNGCLSVIEHAKKNKITPVISHRSRETHDTAICKLAQMCPIAKFGIAGIRTVKLNGLLRLWHTTAKPKMEKLRI